MAVPLEKFVKQLQDSGIIAGDTLKNFLPPKSEPKTAEELARELVRQKKLTKFQAEEVSKGKGKSLTLGNYVLMEKIGAGGMGQVFKAEHRRMHRIVAVKVLPASTMKDPATVARFEREVTAAAKLRHPNIIAADDADQANDVHFLVMEYVDGSDLSALVKKNGPFPVDKAVNYIMQAAKGLEFAHAEGVVHRDIKPANLLLDKKGTVKILDMGLARLSLDGDEAPQADLTSTGTIMGTVDYMAPEQAEDTKSADARADVYALGCSLFYLLTGRATYDGDTLMKKVLAHRDRPIPSLRLERPDVSDQLETVFKKMVAKKAEDRYQTMTELIAALERSDYQGRPVNSVTPQMTSGSADSAVSVDLGQTTLLMDLSLPPTIPAPSELIVMPPTKVSGTKWTWISGGIVGIALLAVVISLIRPKDGTPIVGSDQSGATEPTKEEVGPEEIKKSLYFQTPGFDPWAKSVADLSAEEQVKAVVKKLQELNPSFDGKVSPAIVNGAVQELGLICDDVTDISPLRALVGLNAVGLYASDSSPGKVADLSPLSGIPLTRLAITRNPVRDLSPLKGMPLEIVHLVETEVSDLSPLRGMPLHFLHMPYNSVSNLSPLQDMKLNYLCCVHTPVFDLSPLRGMPLKHFDCNSSKVIDLSPLQESQLESIFCHNTGISDLSPLKGMRLTNVDCGQTSVSDLSPLKDMPLKTLTIDFRPERDTELLRSIQTLETINNKPAAEFWKGVE